MLRSKGWRIVLVAAVAAAAIWSYAFLSGEHGLAVTFLDVGEGACTVIRTPSGKTIVVDCGTSSWRKPESVGKKLVAPYLQSLGVDTIDVAILTHPHADHVSGYAGLLRAKPARIVIDIGEKHASPHYTAFLKSVELCNATYRVARAGQLIDMGDGVSLRVLNPDPARAESDLNESSIVLRLTYGEAAFLLAADAGDDTERSILAGGAEVASQVLQVGHHGSAGSTSPEWLAAVKPKLAVISCGRRNEYGHPSRETTDRLRAFGVRTYRTDLHGAVEFTTNGKSISVRTFRHPGNVAGLGLLGSHLEGISRQ
jgi:competence protein ComEC